ncbi:MAG: agglutinin biogenesis protein [Nitrosomonadales bacterium]|nr:agglutinin biogenesis protein [Nitrosomonadales bacterium]
MKQQWEKLVAKIDSMSLRERVLIFAAIAFLAVSLINQLFLNPLLEKQKILANQVVQQQEKIKEIRAQMEALMDAKRNDVDSPLRKQLIQARQQIADGDAYLQGLRDRLVQPEKMAGLLQRVLKKEGQLELVNLQTLPATPLIEEKPPAEGVKIAPPDAAQQVYTHRVKITVRGSYADLLQYLTTLERLPVQMFWGTASMKVAQYPSAELTLTLYTLSLDKTWLQI